MGDNDSMTASESAYPDKSSSKLTPNHSLDQKPESSATPRVGWLVGILVVVVAIVYLNSLWGAFVFDDDHAIVLNPNAMSIQNALESYFTNRRGFVYTTFAINYRVAGHDPTIYHATNLAIHLAAVLVLFGLVRRTFASPAVSGKLRPQGLLIAFAVALIWGVHPLNTQAVTYVVQRMESLMGLFFLLTIYLLLRSSCSNRPIVWGIASIVACWLGMACKEVMVVAPIVALLYDRTFISGSFIETVKARGWIYAGLMLTWLQLAAPNFIIGASATSDTQAGFDMTVVTPLQYLLSEGEVILRYIWLAFWPMSMTIDWGWPPYQAVTPRLLITAGLVATLVVAAFVASWRKPAIGFPALSFFLVLGPTSSIMPVADLMMEHRMYLPLICIVILAVLAIFEGSRRLAVRGLIKPANVEMFATLLVVLLASGLGVRTVIRNMDYYSDIALWKAAISVQPYQARAHHNLGSSLQKAGHIDEAVRHYERSIELAPKNPDAYNNLGLLLLDLGDPERAEQLLRKAFDAAPDDPSVHYNLGLLKYQLNDYEAAEAWFKSAIELRRGYAAAWNNLGMTYLRVRRVQEARSAFEHAVASATVNMASEYKLNLANLLLDSGKRREAEGLFREIADRDPRMRPAALRGLGNALALQSKLSEAAVAFEESLADGPDLSTLRRLSRVYVLMNQPANAVDAYGVWMESNPSDISAALDLAWILATHPDDGVRDGGRATALSTKFYQRSTSQTPALLDTLAASHAEQGDYAKAIGYANQARVQLQSLGHDSLAAAVEARIESYQNGQAWHRISPRLPD